MLTGRLEGRLLNFLVGLVQPRQVLEIGCFTGYSALSMAEALPEGGKLYTCEISREHADVLWSGRVLDDADQTADTKAIRALNEQLARDERVEVVMLTVRDGLTLVRRRSSH